MRDKLQWVLRLRRVIAACDVGREIARSLAVTAVSRKSLMSDTKSGSLAIPSVMGRSFLKSSICRTCQRNL